MSANKIDELIYQMLEKIYFLEEDTSGSGISKTGIEVNE